jgi:hypothetical protein
MKYVRCYLEFFLGGGSYENPQGNEVGDFTSRDRHCHKRKMSTTMKNFFFARKEWLEKTKNVIYNV